MGHSTHLNEDAHQETKPMNEAFRKKAGIGDEDEGYTIVEMILEAPRSKRFT